MRTLQYFSRFYAWYLYRTNASTSEIAPYAAIKSQFGLIRKGLRLGKFVEHIKAAAQAWDAKTGVMDPFIRYCAVGRQLGYAVYLSCDNLHFLHLAGIKTMKSATEVQKRGQRAWLVGLSFNAMAGLYQLYALRVRGQQVNLKEGEGVVEKKRIERWVCHSPLNEEITDVAQGNKRCAHPAAQRSMRHDCAVVRARSSAVPGRRHRGSGGNDKLADWGVFGMEEDCVKCEMKASGI